MAEQEQTQRPADRTGAKSDHGEIETAGSAEEVSERIDDLLDEIDTVLEENAEEFVKNYVQKGGQ
jgi:ubiquitin-like protein Pup